MAKAKWTFDHLDDLGDVVQQFMINEFPAQSLTNKKIQRDADMTRIRLQAFLIDVEDELVDPIPDKHDD